MATKKKQTRRITSGVLHSVYFRSKKELQRVRQASKVSGIRLSVLMRDAILERSEKLIAKGKAAA